MKRRVSLSCMLAPCCITHHYQTAWLFVVNCTTRTSLPNLNLCLELPALFEVQYDSETANDANQSRVILFLLPYHTSTHSARASPVSHCTSAFRAALLLPMCPRKTRCTPSAARSDASHFRRAKRRNSLRLVPRHISLCASSMLASLDRHQGWCHLVS